MTNYYFSLEQNIALYDQVAAVIDCHQKYMLFFPNFSSPLVDKLCAVLGRPSWAERFPRFIRPFLERRYDIKPSWNDLAQVVDGFFNKGELDSSAWCGLRGVIDVRKKGYSPKHRKYNDLVCAAAVDYMCDLNSHSPWRDWLKDTQGSLGRMKDAFGLGQQFIILSSLLLF